MQIEILIIESINDRKLRSKLTTELRVYIYINIYRSRDCMASRGYAGSMSNSRATVPTPDLYLYKSQFSASWNVQLTVFHCHLYRSSPFVYTFPFCGPTRATFKENRRKKKKKFVCRPYPSNRYRHFFLNFRDFSSHSFAFIYEYFITGVSFFSTKLIFFY